MVAKVLINSVRRHFKVDEVGQCLGLFNPLFQQEMAVLLKNLVIWLL